MGASGISESVVASSNLARCASCSLGRHNRFRVWRRLGGIIELGSEAQPIHVVIHGQTHKGNETRCLKLFEAAENH
jgi:hypothetical protein